MNLFGHLDSTHVTSFIGEDHKMIVQIRTKRTIHQASNHTGIARLGKKIDPCPSHNEIPMFAISDANDLNKIGK